MSTFTIRVDTDSAAFIDNGGAELARILRRIADDVDSITIPIAATIKTQRIVDVNGNRVGGWRWDGTCECGAHPVERGYTHSDWQRDCDECGADSGEHCRPHCTADPNNR